MDWLREHDAHLGVVAVVNPKPCDEGLYLIRGPDGSEAAYELWLEDGTREQVHESMLTLLPALTVH
jgi:hypothetical protein